MTLVRSAALGLLLTLPFSAFGQTPWRPLWSLPSIPSGNWSDLAVAADDSSHPGYAISLSQHRLTIWDLATGTSGWTVGLKPDAMYFQNVAVGAGHLAIVRRDAIEVRKLSDGSLVRTIPISTVFQEGLAVRKDRLYWSDKVYTWPEGESVTGETPVWPQGNDNGRFSADGKCYAGYSWFTGAGGYRELKGNHGRFSPDSARVYSYYQWLSTYNCGAVFAQKAADGSLLWSFVPKNVRIYSALPLGNGYVLVSARTSNELGSDLGGAVLLVLNGKTGKVVGRLDDPEFDNSASPSGPMLVAASPTQGKAFVYTRANRTWVLRRVDVDAQGVPSQSPVDYTAAGDGVDFAGDRPVVYAPSERAYDAPLSTVYKPDRTVAWRASLYPRSHWAWMSDQSFNGSAFTPDGKFAAATLTGGEYIRTFNGVTGAVLSRLPDYETTVDFVYPLDGANAIGDSFTDVFFYQRSGRTLKLSAKIANGLALGTDIDGKRFVVGGRNQGEIAVFQASDGKLLNSLPTGSLEKSDHPRAFLNGDVLTTLTVTEPTGITRRVTATVWKLGTPPVKVRTVVRDYTPPSGVNSAYSISAALSPDGRQLLIQPRVSVGFTTLFPFELVRMADGRTVAKLTPDEYGESAVDIAISKNGSRVMLALYGYTQAYAAMPGVVDSLAAEAVSRKQALVTVRLIAPAPPAGAPVRFRFTPNLATAPQGAMVPAGASSATFRVPLGAVAMNTNLKIEAAAVEDDWMGTSLQLAPPAVSALSLAPSLVEGGTEATLRITLDGPAPQGGLSLAILSDKTFAKPPTSVTIPAGTQKLDVKVPTQAVNEDGTATLTVGNKSVALQVTKAVPTTLSLSPASSTVRGGKSVVLKLSLSKNAPAGGLVASLSSDNVVASVPSSVTVPAGSRSVTFRVTTTDTATATTVAIKAFAGDKAAQAAITVEP